MFSDCFSKRWKSNSLLLLRKKFFDLSFVEWITFASWNVIFPFLNFSISPSNIEPSLPKFSRRSNERFVRLSSLFSVLRDELCFSWWIVNERWNGSSKKRIGRMSGRSRREALERFWKNINVPSLTNNSILSSRNSIQQWRESSTIKHSFANSSETIDNSLSLSLSLSD